MDVSVDSYWAKELGVSVEQLNQPGVVMVSEERGGFEGYPGVLFFRRNDTLIVSAEPGAASVISRSLGDLSPAAVEDIGLLRQVVGVEPRRVIGPAFQGFVTSGQFRRPVATQEMATTELPTVESQLGAVCDEAEWEASGLAGVTGALAVALDDDTVVAAAGLRNREERVVDPCVLTHPDHRGRGLATGLVACVTARALKRGDLVVYQTLMSNQAAVRIAYQLGFELYATGVAMRLA